MPFVPDQPSGCIDQATQSLRVNVVAGGAGGGASTIADGADVAQGTTSDVAWSSGAGTVIALLKKIASGGGSAVSIADGSDVAEGVTTDAAVTSDSNGTVSGKLRGLVKIFADVWDSVNHRLKVDGSGVTQPVSGTVAVSGTVPVSNAGLTNLDVALSTRTKPADQQHVIIDTIPSTAVTGPLTDTQLRATPVPVSGTVSVTNFANPLPVSGTFWQGTQPISATALPLPTGAATDASLVTLDTDLKTTLPRSIVGSVAVTPSNVSMNHADIWALIGIQRQILVEIRALRMMFSTVSGQYMEDDDFDTQIQ